MINAAAIGAITSAFEGNNGHDADVTRCLLMTQSGHSSVISRNGHPWEDAQAPEPSNTKRVPV